MKKKDANELLGRYLEGCNTEEEKTLLLNWFHEFGAGHKSDLTEEDLRIGQQEMWNMVQAQTRRSYNGWYGIAAAVALIVLSIGVLLFRSNQTRPSGKANYANEILPGGNNAVLILANGSKIDLNKIIVGQVVKQAGLNIKKTNNGQLVYDYSSEVEVPEESKISFNTMVIPNGGTYQVILSDGTKVWLNAASTLKYPTSFPSDKRTVELVGEGYFDNSRPFMVKSGKQEVAVLGTHFNVSAYQNDEVIKTTLLQGSVMVNFNLLAGAVSNKSVQLNPGQQAQLSGFGMVIKEVDAEAAIDWKNDKFLFKNENIKSIMKKLSRWYNIEVAYQGDVEQLRFGGKVSRSKNLDEALRILTLTGDVHVKVEGRRVIIMP
jgi:transmembrane sensor